MVTKTLSKTASSALEGTTAEKNIWLTHSLLNVVVIGASGDLAKKKTYPSLLNLFEEGLLPANTTIWGYSRSKLTDEDLRNRLRPFLCQTSACSEGVVDEFLKLCNNQSGESYGDLEAFSRLNASVAAAEESHPGLRFYNRLFYFAIPPNVFADAGLAIKKTCMQVEGKGWTRLIIEKPFGRDLESFEVGEFNSCCFSCDIIEIPFNPFACRKNYVVLQALNDTLSEHFTEQHLYRIDHYLGKEMVQNIPVFRFSNSWLERIWNRDNIQSVICTFKEPFGTEGRGGYFDQYGIIRDILQNHLLQVLTLLTMEPPETVEGPDAGKAIRDAKVAVLNCIPPIALEDVVLGQYEGYADDPTILNKDTNSPTLAVVRLRINNPRWYGVPIILKAGKALDERKAEVRVQFKDAPAGGYLFEGHDCPRNELGKCILARSHDQEWF